jgi:hypothetical protein
VSTPDPTPHAYLTWRCATCGSELLEERTEDYDLRCETCGYTWRMNGMHAAVYVPDPDDLEDGDDG